MKTNDEELRPDQPYPFLEGGSEAGNLIRSFDWTDSPVGTPAEWPASLQTILNIMLHSAFPMFLFWGKELVCFYNDAFRPSLGANGKHPAIGKKGKEVWPEIWDFIGPLIEQVMKTGEPVWFEDQLVSFYRNGKIEDIYWTFSYSAAFDDNGKTNGVFVTCTETTEKVLSVKKLVETEKKIHTLVRESTVGIATLIGEDSVVEIANEAFANLTGVALNQLVGKAFFEVAPDTIPCLKAVVDKVRTLGKPAYSYSRPCSLHNGEDKREVYLDIVYQPYKENGGLTTGVMVRYIDVTQQVLARQKIEEVVTTRTKELAEANKNLKRSNEQLEHFAHIASHDLKEPVRKITTFTHMLESSLGTLDERSRILLDKIKKVTAGMTALVDDILAYSELSTTTLRFENVKLQEIINEIEKDYELLIQEKKAQINLIDLPVLEANRRQIFQLFANLIANALKFSKSNLQPVIDISCSVATKEEIAKYALNKNKDYYHIKVADNGIGFDNEYAEKILRFLNDCMAKKNLMAQE